MKIVINRCFGGFGVSKAVYDELGIPWDDYGYLSNSDFGIESSDYDKYRAHPAFVKAVEAVGVEQASGVFAELKIVDIPDGVDWYIENYDGMEHVAEQHRTW